MIPIWQRPDILAGQARIGQGGVTSQIQVQVPKQLFPVGKVLIKDPAQQIARKNQDFKRFSESGLYDTDLYDFIGGNQHDPLLYQSLLDGLNDLGAMKTKQNALYIDRDLYKAASRQARTGTNTPQNVQRIAAAQLLKAFQGVQAAMKVLASDDGNVLWNIEQRLAPVYKAKQRVMSRKQQIVKAIQDPSDPVMNALMSGKVNISAAVDALQQEVIKMTQQHNDNPSDASFQNLVQASGMLYGYQQMLDNKSQLSKDISTAQNQLQSLFATSSKGRLEYSQPPPRSIFVPKGGLRPQRGTGEKRDFRRRAGLEISQAQRQLEERMGITKIMQARREQAEQE